MPISEVYIYGSKYRIKSDEDKEYLDNVALLVTNKMKELEENMQILTTSKLAVMVAFGLADELMQLKKDLDLDASKIEELKIKLESIE